MRNIALGLGINLFLAAALSLLPAALRRSRSDHIGKIDRPAVTVPSGHGNRKPAPDRSVLSPSETFPSPAVPTSGGAMATADTDIMAMAPPRPTANAAKRPATAFLPSESEIASSAALASLAGAESLPHRSVAPLSAPPDKGVEILARMALSQATQRADDKNTAAPYTMRNQTYGLGIRKDVSLNGVAGLSADLFKARVESTGVNDNRHNNIDGFTFAASYEHLFAGAYLASARVFYGSMTTSGGGAYSVMPGADPFIWSEEKYRSATYGAAVSFGVPLILGRDIRVVPEIGLEYAALDSAGHWANPAEYWPDIAIPRHKATSLSVPVNLRVKKDFLLGWGLFTARLGGGYARELRDGGESVRTLGASAAAPLFLGPFGSPAEGIIHKSGPRNFYRLDAGVDLFSNGGWKVAADYTRRIASGYHSDVFALELGKCF